MGFEDILKEWELNGNSKKAPQRIKTRKVEQRDTMDSFLNLYPPGEGSGEIPPSKPTLRQKRRNYRRMKPQEVLDLHGFSLVSAAIELEDFLSRCRKRKIEKVLIIHGKGLHSPEGEAVLRNSIRNELSLLAFIGEIGHPSEREGGAGATWAIIKY